MLCSLEWHPRQLNTFERLSLRSTRMLQVAEAAQAADRDAELARAAEVIERLQSALAAVSHTVAAGAAAAADVPSPGMHSDGCAAGPPQLPRPGTPPALFRNPTFEDSADDCFGTPMSTPPMPPLGTAPGPVRLFDSLAAGAASSRGRDQGGSGNGSSFAEGRQQQLERDVDGAGILCDGSGGHGGGSVECVVDEVQRCLAAAALARQAALTRVRQLEQQVCFCTVECTIFLLTITRQDRAC